MRKREQENFTLTKHAQNRIRERFPEAIKEIGNDSSAIRIRKMYEFLWNSTVENRSINDSRFMQFIYEKYGFEKRYRFFANQDMMFIGVVKAEGNFIVTVVNRYNYITQHLRPTTKKLQKKPDTYRKIQLHAARTHRLRTTYEFRMKKNEHLEDYLSDD